jgi:hypothetical protein
MRTVIIEVVIDDLDDATVNSDDIVDAISNELPLSLYINSDDYYDIVSVTRKLI